MLICEWRSRHVTIKEDLLHDVSPKTLDMSSSVNATKDTLTCGHYLYYEGLVHCTIRFQMGTQPLETLFDNAILTRIQHSCVPTNGEMTLLRQHDGVFAEFANCICLDIPYR